MVEELDVDDSRVLARLSVSGDLDSPVAELPTSEQVEQIGGEGQLEAGVRDVRVAGVCGRRRIHPRVDTRRIDGRSAITGVDRERRVDGSRGVSRCTLRRASRGGGSPSIEKNSRSAGDQGHRVFTVPLGPVSEANTVADILSKAPGMVERRRIPEVSFDLGTQNMRYGERRRYTPHK